MIKKIMAVLLSLVLLGAQVSAFEGYREEDFSFDIYDIHVNKSDRVSLMEVSDDVYEELERRVITAWENMETEVDISDLKIHKSEIKNLVVRIFYENPMYYYFARSFSGTSNSTTGNMGKLTKLLYNINDKAEIEAVWAEIDKATEEILFHISPDMTDFEKVMTVHDYMDLHYVYDLNDMDQTYFILLDKRGVCAAYAEAFQHLMNVLEIDCTLVSSEKMGHIWNMVKIDNRWYHADITWDDPVPDQFARVCHEYMLLSENAIKSKGHTDFEAPYYAGSTTYNNVEWRDDEASLVTVGGVLYRVEGNNLIDENAAVIYENLDGGDGKWNFSKTSGVPNVVWAGLCEINEVLYFNTDAGIYSYNPKTQTTECVKEEYGICGLFADNNVIQYGTYDFTEQLFIKKGEMTVCETFVKEIVYDEGEAVVRLYNDCDEPAWIISGGAEIDMHKVDAKSSGVARFETGEEQKIFIWKENMEPLTEALK